jgi:hypothetical protein
MVNVINLVKTGWKPCNTNCSSKCRIANFEFTMVNADRSTKPQIERSENMRHLVD